MMDQASQQYNDLSDIISDKLEVLDQELDMEIEEYIATLKKEELLADLKAFKRDKLAPLLVLIFYAAVALHFIHGIFQFIRNIYFVELCYFSYSSIGSAFWLCVPIIVFLISTNYKFWNFRLQKSIILWLSACSVIMELSKYIYLATFTIFIPLIAKMPIVKGITCSMLLYLMQFILVMSVLTFSLWLLLAFYGVFTDRDTKADLMSFRINKYINKATFSRFDKYAYNQRFMQKMSNGFRFCLCEADRFLHLLVDGATGTGKTSSTLIPMAVDDMDTRVRNEDKQKEKLLKAVQKGKVTLTKPFSDADFSIDNFKARTGHEKVLKNIKKKYRVAGMTVVAPDASLTDKIYEYCKKREIPCNRIDPEYDLNTMRLKEGFIGFNPLLIPKNITPDHPKYDSIIIRTAALCADVVQAIVEMGGKSEQYFSSVNRNVIICFIILAELTFEKVTRRKPLLTDIQDWINNFGNAKKYFDEFKKLPAEIKERYKFVGDFVQNDILPSTDKKSDNKRQKEMINHTTGLRIIMNEILANPSIRAVLCAEKSIDMDAILAEGQITVVNYSQEMGDKDATVLGLMFALSFNNTCLRRPGTEDTRLPHMYVIDEFPVLLHPQFEKCTTLFRKYRVATTFAIQTLDQMERSEMTRYLSGVIVGNCSTKILYGRINISEMRIFEELSGKKRVEKEDTTVSQTAITNENPNFSYGTRSSVVEESVMSGSEMRNLNFQEVTVFGVQNGSVVPPFFARVSFLDHKKTKKVKRLHIDWESVYYDYCADADNVDDTRMLFHSSHDLLTNAGEIDEGTQTPAAPTSDEPNSFSIY